MNKILIASTAFLALGACTSTATPPEAPAILGEVTGIDTEMRAWMDEAFEDRLALSPEFQTYLGRKTSYGEWNDYSDEAALRYSALIRDQLATLRARYDRASLSEEGKLNYDLFEHSAEQSLALDPFRSHQFALSQFRGPHSSMPVFLTNYHRVETKEDMEAYISRVSKMATVLDQNATLMETRAARGYQLPDFSWPLIIEAAANVTKGAPFNDGPDSPMWADFNKKLDALDADTAWKEEKRAEAKSLLLTSVAPAYTDFSARIEALSQKSRGNYGVGSVSGNDNGDAFYNALLKNYTSSDLTAEEVHQLGLAEVARIHSEMRAIMNQVGFEGSLQDFFTFMRTDDQFYYDNTDEGRAQYLDDARYYISLMEPRLDELFITKPQAPVIVRRVEPFRERAAGKAFYNQPAPDGSRPGIFYANLADMKQMPTYQLEALVYHEAIPGHHMQRAIQIEMQDLPKFRQYAGYTAFTEGWGLYSEYLGKDVGLYEDPYSDFGRLAMELWRAARLVVDTGLHYKGWEMREAIDYLTENTPNPEGDCVKAIERYIVFPGQATAYKVGMLKIMELRARSEAALGNDFNIAEFHDLILTGGPMPLAVLEARVDEFIEARR